MDRETLRRMQVVTAETWRIEGPAAPWHVGDLAWQRFQIAGRENDWLVRLWQHDGVDVAWAWLRLPNSELSYCVRPDCRETLADELLGWLEAEAPGPVPAVEVQTTDGVMPAALERRGYRVDESRRPMAFHHRRLAQEPMPAVPVGFKLRTLETREFAQRVELHRSVWAPSRVTEDSYRDVQAAWPYRSDLDCIVEAPDGRLAAYCLAWLDVANRAGELEPVGTHPDFRRQGLASAVCRFALRRLEEEGATRAMVYAVVDPENPGPKALYESIGFREVSRTHRYVRPVA